MKDQSIFLSDDETLHFVGPSLDAGPLPAFFYFSLSGKESLTLDPFNQPVTTLAHLPVRIFSLDIPGHGPGQDPKEALSLWADELRKGHDFISAFSAKVEKALNFLSHRHCLLEDKVGIGGLSRGAFLALHLGARLSLFNPILGFAPLTCLDQSQQVIKKGVTAEAAQCNVAHLIPALLSKTVRLYIGNRDTTVGTMNAIHFVQSLTEAKFKAEHRELDAELILKPSIGNKGHGTSPKAFAEGARWMAQTLEVWHD